MAHKRSLSVPRQSRRQRGLPPSDEFVLLTPEVSRYGSLKVERRTKYNRTTGDDLGDWAYRVDRTRRRKDFFPGQVVMALDLHPQCNLNRTLEDEEVAQTKSGPVSAKFRAMIVLNLTATGLHCLPLYSHTSGTPLSDARWAELVSISTNHYWQGETPWAGLPLRMVVRKPRFNRDSFVHLSEPVHVCTESRIDSVGYLPGAEFMRLIELVEYREDIVRANAFRTYNVGYLRQVQGSWWPAYGDRYADDLTKIHMNAQTKMRWG